MATKITADDINNLRKNLAIELQKRSGEGSV